MSELRIANRYAKALLKSVPESELQVSLDALQALTGLFADQAVGKVLRSPVIPGDLKVQILDNGLEQVSAPQIMRNFIRMVADAGRVASLPAVCHAFERLKDEKAGLLRVNVTSAQSVSEDDLNELRGNLAEVFGKKIKIATQQDPSILGGMVLSMGNRKLDLSLKTRLERLAQSAIA